MRGFLRTLAGGLSVVALGVVSPGVAEDLPDPSDGSLPSLERVTTLIERMRIEQKSFSTLHATFEQRTVSEMLLEPEIASGEFFYQAPDKVRWEYHEPTPKTILVDGGQMTTWFQDLGRAETLRVGRHSDRVLKYLGASGSLETLMEYFTLRVRWPEVEGPEAPYRLHLTPRYDRIAKRLEVVDVEVDPRRFIPVRLHYVEPNGDVTDYVFTEVDVDVEISPERFELALPADVEVRERTRP